MFLNIFLSVTRNINTAQNIYTRKNSYLSFASMTLASAKEAIETQRFALRNIIPLEGNLRCGLTGVLYKVRLRRNIVFITSS